LRGHSGIGKPRGSTLSGLYDSDNICLDLEDYDVNYSIFEFEIYNIFSQLSKRLYGKQYDIPNKIHRSAIIQPPFQWVLILNFMAAKLNIISCST
jgi:hypothetical protein